MGNGPIAWHVSVQQRGKYEEGHRKVICISGTLEALRDAEINWGWGGGGKGARIHAVGFHAAR